MGTMKIRRDGTVKLPAEILALFPIGSAVAFERSGRSVILKRSVGSKAPRRVARRIPEVMAIEDVAEEIHDIRRERRGPKA